MTSSPLRIAASLLLASTLATAPAETIDMNNLPNYANQTKPAYITQENSTAGIPITNAGATLGRVMFYDVRLSKNNTVSCSTCHQQARGFSDDDIASTGVNGTTGRHSMRLINARFAREVKFFWDERAVDLEDQVTKPIQDHAEMGFSGANGDQSLADLITKMNSTTYYPYLFNQVYGTPTITEDRMQRALSQFVRSIQSFDSKYDVGRAQVANNNVNFPNFTTAENAGKTLFTAAPVFGPGGVRTGGGAGCQGCHSAPEFDIDPNTRSNGVITKIGATFNVNNPTTYDLTNRRSPTLRDMENSAGVLHGGLMHDGSFTSLAQVINHYNQIPAIVTNANIVNQIDNRLLPGGNPQNLNLTQTDKDNLIAFLHTLRGTSVYTDIKYANPFDVNGNLSILQLNSHVTGWLMY